MVTKRPAPAIPQTDPRAGYLAQRTAIDAAIARVLDSGVYILGREVEVFEAAFADFVGVAHAIGVASGTDAIEIALRACGIGLGDLVFSVSHTAVATIAAIERAVSVHARGGFSGGSAASGCGVVEVAIGSVG
jgi:dTDP-4-amino-4,6-dideoxygalactose transaminase